MPIARSASPRSFGTRFSRPSTCTESTRPGSSFSALGIDRDGWEYLRDQIASRVEEAEVSEVRAGNYGVRYSVPMLIEGLNGQTHEVTTGWIVEKEGASPRLTSAYVNVP